MSTDNTPNSDTEWEVDQEDFTPEGPLKDGQEIIDGNFIIDKNGVRRAANGRALPGVGIRRPGVRQQSFREFKHSMLIAYHRNGGTEWLTEWGRQHPALFFKLMAKMLPQAVSIDEKKATMEVNITWADKTRLSYQNPEPTVLPTQVTEWKEGQEEQGLAHVLREADKAGK